MHDENEEMKPSRGKYKTWNCCTPIFSVEGWKDNVENDEVVEVEVAVEQEEASKKERERT